MKFSYLISLFFLIQTCAGTAQDAESKSDVELVEPFKIVKSDEQWKEVLTDEEYYILREKGTERPYTGEYNDVWEDGVYHCAGCGSPLYKSDTKFECGTGWPAFYEEVEGAVIYQTDTSLGMRRTEVLCASCGGHLGHVFNDSPQTPTGKRHCINSGALNFEEE